MEKPQKFWGGGGDTDGCEIHPFRTTLSLGCFPWVPGLQPTEFLSFDFQLVWWLGFKL